jgi:hypothetical protein
MSNKEYPISKWGFMFAGFAYRNRCGPASRMFFRSFLDIPCWILVIRVFNVFGQLVEATGPFAEFTLRRRPRSFASLRMTGEGLKPENLNIEHPISNAGRAF